MGGVQGPQDASFPFMNFSMLSLVNVVKADPAVAHVNGLHRHRATAASCLLPSSRSEASVKRA